MVTKLSRLAPGIPPYRSTFTEITRVDVTEPTTAKIGRRIAAAIAAATVLILVGSVGNRAPDGKTIVSSEALPRIVPPTEPYLQYAVSHEDTAQQLETLELKLTCAGP